MSPQRVLILTVSHGASHERAAAALKKGLAQAEPRAEVRIVNALALCPLWFRLYYDSYLLPLRYCPSVWGWIENRQHEHDSTNPVWLYRRAVEGLQRFIEDFAPDVLVATEVGVCEMVALLKRERGLRRPLVGLITGMDVDRAWARPEVDLYVVSPGGPADCLRASGVGAERIVACGQPIDPEFAALPDRASARARNGVEGDAPLLLVLFGGSGFGRPRQIVAELKKLRRAFQAVLVAGRNERLRQRLESFADGSPDLRTCGWVNNIHEWMAAADLIITKPGASTLVESLSCGLPMLALDPLPGNERRACDWIEANHLGHWVRKASDLSPLLDGLLSRAEALNELRARALAFARPSAAIHAAQAIASLNGRAVPKAFKAPRAFAAASSRP
jgi:processive 1,2-diacylglycerol beta-glucosyltransferase